MAAGDNRDDDRQKVRIIRTPPSTQLEGFDLRSLNLEKGTTIDVPTRLAAVLIAWEYARPERPGANRVDGHWRGDDRRRPRRK